MKLIIASPRGFCAGVNRAICALSEAVRRENGAVWALHEIVHNRHVVQSFCDQGVQFVNSIDQIPQGATVLFSAHGIAPSVRQRAKERALRVIDATCPLVERVHQQARQKASLGYQIFYIGHEGHQEVLGTLGEAPDQMTLVPSITVAEQLPLEAFSGRKLTYLMQTTLSCAEANKIVEILRKRFPSLESPADPGICFATRHRQGAVQQLLPEADALVVVGSRNSSNSRRLEELGQAAGKRSLLIDSEAELKPDDFQKNETVLLTSGASAPEEIVQKTALWFQNHFDAQIEERVVYEEKAVFKPVF